MTDAHQTKDLDLGPRTLDLEPEYFFVRCPLKKPHIMPKKTKAKNKGTKRKAGSPENMVKVTGKPVFEKNLSSKTGSGRDQKKDPGKATFWEDDDDKKGRLDEEEKHWGLEEKMEDDEFRFHNKSAGLTYSDKKSVLCTKDFLDWMEQHGCKGGLIGQEEHSDGTPHYHVVVMFPEPVDTTNCRYFDIKEVHPNIRRLPHKKSVHNFSIYACKDGLTTTYKDHFFLNWKNYDNDKRNLDSYVRDRQVMKLKSPFPIVMPDGKVVQEPTKETRRAILVVVGYPGVGKSSWVEETFKGKKICKVFKEPRKEFDAYCGQQVIICDDYWPSIEAMIDITNYYQTETPVWGFPRYKKIFWPMNQKRMLIVLCNFIKLELLGDTRFTSRVLLAKWPMTPELEKKLQEDLQMKDL